MLAFLYAQKKDSELNRSPYSNYFKLFAKIFMNLIKNELNLWSNNDLD